LFFNYLKPSNMLKMNFLQLVAENSISATPQDIILGS